MNYAHEGVGWLGSGLLWPLLTRKVKVISMAEVDESLRREVRIKPGPDPKRVRMEWLLHGRNGTVQFVAWVTGRPDPNFPTLTKHDFYPLDLGYHAHTEQYEGQARMDECEFMPDGKGCFYDGTSLGAEDLWARVLDEGDTALWERLEAWYADLEVASDETQAEPSGEAPEIPVFEGTRDALSRLSVRKGE